MKNILALIALLALFPLRAEAAALSFNVAPGGLAYDPMAQVFVANGTVTAVDGLSTDISGQPFYLSAALLGTAIDLGAGTLTAQFGSVPGADLEIPGFLTGEFTSLLMVGALDSDFGLLSGLLELTGVLAPEFGAPGVLVSLQFNMSAPFSDALFQNAFTASLDGQVISAPVPEPASTGLFIAFFIGTIAALRALRARPVPARFQHAA